MHKIITLVICCCILVGLSYAEDLGIERQFINAASQATVWQQLLNNRAAEINDEESKYLLEQAALTLERDAYLLLDAYNSDNVLDKDFGDILVSDANVQDVDGVITCTTAYIRYDNVIVKTDAYWQENYLSIRVSFFDEKGAYVATERLDVARRDDKILLYINNYDAEMMWTSRYAVLCDSEDGKLIFTRTLGMITEIRMDIRAWLEGKDFESWDTTLLYAMN